MANNRMQLYCKKCLEMITIAKYYPIEWYCQDEKVNRMNDFLLKHSKCYLTGDKKCDFSEGANMFGFRNECDNDEFISDYSETPFRLKKKK